MGSKKLQILLPILFAVIMALGMLIGYQLREHSGSKTFLNAGKKNSIQEVMDLVKAKYVDVVKTDSIAQLAIEELLAHLDPHSVYIPATNVKEVNEDLMGNFQGIGVEFQMFDDTVNVINVVKGGPSEKAGVKIGDKIIKVDDSIKIAGVKINADDIRKYLRGPENSKVTIGIVRNEKLQNINIIRGTIPVSTIDAAYIIAPATGFIRINKFGDRTYEEFMENLEKLQKHGMTKLILDLRGNGGGLMSEATDIADEFLSNDKLIVYTQGNKSPRYNYKCKRDGLFEEGKLVILVDETSASASEVLTAALQDWDRATIVGRRTFGKGLVQQQFMLSDKSAVRLTVARYYSPLGRNIQKTYANKSKREYEEELIERFHNGEVIKGDSSKPMGTSFKTPAGRLVYGGGGITPDIFVGTDIAGLQKEIATLFTKGIINKFIYTYYIDNQNYFQSFKTPLDFANKYIPNEKEWNVLENFAAKDSISLKQVLPKNKIDLLKRIQYLMARQIFRNEGYFEVANKNDSAVIKGILILN